MSLSGPSPEKRSPPPEPSSEIQVPLEGIFRFRRQEIHWDQSSGFHGGPRRQGRRLILWSFTASLIDALLLLSASCFFLLAFAFVMRSPLAEAFRGVLALGTLKLFAGTFLSVSWIYLVTTRVFFGFSIGEWACGLRLGEPRQRFHWKYPFQVMTRSSLILLTGFVSLPVLSLLTGRDFAGKISGIPLISLR